MEQALQSIGGSVYQEPPKGSMQGNDDVTLSRTRASRIPCRCKACALRGDDSCWLGRSRCAGCFASQAEFAMRFGLALDTLQSWEQRCNQPYPAARLLLKVIEL